ncbi:MAG: tetratricopeptide repeat protein [Elusimicrobia bacterium]|nr:tetratricopeptide repeat protein [Elusimicrobiota bacterium]
MRARTLITAFAALGAVCVGLGRPSALAFELHTKTQRAQKLVEEGQGMILRGELLQAIDSCTRALDIRNDWAPAYLCRSEARILTRDPEAGKDAQLDAEAALKLDPNSGEPWRLLGLMDFQAERYDAALKQFDNALKRSKMRPEGIPDVYFYKAKSHLNLGKYPEALKDVERGLGIVQGINGDFSDWSFYSLRAEIRRKSGQKEKADKDERYVVQLITEKLKRRPNVAALIRQRGDSYVHLREYDKAIADYTAVLSRTPEDAKTFIDRAQAQRLAGRHTAAESDLTSAIALEPKNAQALRMRALERMELKDYQGTVDDLDAYLALEPDDATAISYRGMAKSFLHDFRGSLDDLELAQELKPSEDSLWGAKAFDQEMLGDHAGAMISALKGIAANADDFSAHYARARSGMALGRCKDAAPSIEWLLKKSPQSWEYYWIRGECRCDEGDFAGGLKDLEKAAELDATSPVPSARLAHQHRRYLDLNPHILTIAELRKALHYFDRARAASPLDSMNRIERARTLYDLGALAPDERMKLWREALSECDAVLKVDRKDQSAKELRQRIRAELKPPKKGAGARP